MMLSMPSSYLKICVLFFSFLLVGQAEAQDKKAQALLKEVSAKYKSYKTLRADFRYHLQNTRDKINVTKTGVLYVKQNKFHVELDGQEIICDNKQIWTYNKAAGEVQLSNYDPKDAEVNPSRIFTIFESGFLSQIAEEVTEKGKVLVVVELTPTDKKKSYFKVKLFIDKVTKQIARTRIFDKNGNIYTYEIIKLQPDIKISDKFFLWDAKSHPGVELIDLR